MLEKQNYMQNVIIEKLEIQLQLKSYMNLMLYGSQKECILGLSDYQISKVKIQGRYILYSLKFISKYYNKNKSITW